MFFVLMFLIIMFIVPILFGMFVHWGIYSILGDGEWVMNNQRIRIEELGERSGRRYSVRNTRGLKSGDDRRCRPQPEAHRAPERQAGRLEDAHGLHHHGGARRVVDRAGAGMPRVEVRAEHHELVGDGGVRAGQLGEDVERIQIGIVETILRVDLDAHRDSLVQRARDAAGHLRGVGRRGQCLRAAGRRLRRAGPL